MLFLGMAAFTSFMIGFLREKNFSLEFIAVLMAVGFIVGGIYYAWVLKTQKIKDIA